MLRALTMVVALLGSSAMAQSPQPYASFKDRSVKSLSDQQVVDLKAGRGMGLALAAELNGYPGPMHVLEHADSLGLSSEQRMRTRELIAGMRAEAVPVGERLIQQEAELDQLFASREINPAILRTKTEQIGSTQARLREAHRGIKSCAGTPPWAAVTECITAKNTRLAA
jgi:hypothetical protein